MASACLKIEGEFMVKENKIRFNQKVDFGKAYSFMNNNSILHLKFISTDHKIIQLQASVDQKNDKQIKKSKLQIVDFANNLEESMILFNDFNNSIKLKLKAISI
jgi:hypothetical protein